MNAGLISTVVLALAINPVTPTTLYAGPDGGGVFDFEESLRCGDLNGDGVVDVGDALLAAQYDVHFRACGQAPFIPDVCDVNQDGSCDIGMR
jgi:hypothetical protein